jgi:SpoVK/Ycf46/Vps4 family AAA+-type ATPase
MTSVFDETSLPNAQLAEAWSAIKIPQSIRDRLLAQSLLALTLRQKFTFEQMPIHGLLMLAGPPGTGKTTLARGLAHQIATTLKDTRSRLIEVDPHALTSASLGGSQKAVTKLFQQTIPEYTLQGPCIVLLDEVETLAPSRERMSLEANPIDAHRATDAVLAGVDFLTRKHRNVLLLATTNFPQAVDVALLSRADWVENLGLPSPEARTEIIRDVLEQLATQWPRVAELTRHLGSFVAASEGLDGRRLRKAVVAAAAHSIETARDLNKLKTDDVLVTLKAFAAPRKKEVAA